MKNQDQNELNQDQNELKDEELEQANGAGVNTGNTYRFGRLRAVDPTSS